MPYKKFAPGETLEDADVQQYVMDQAVMVFASASARNAAFTSASSVVSATYPLEGMITYIGSGSVEYYDGAAWQPWPPQ